MVIGSSCGIFVYRLVTPVEAANVTFSATFVFFFSMKLMKSVGSLKITYLCFSNKFEEGFNKGWDSLCRFFTTYYEWSPYWFGL